MVNEEVAAVEEIVLGVAETSKAQETRPSPLSKTNLRLALPNHLLLFPRLPLLTPSSLVTSRPPSSRFLLHRPHHSTRASTKLYLWRGESALPQPLRLSNVLKVLSVPLTLDPSRNVPLLRRTKSPSIGLETRMT